MKKAVAYLRVSTEEQNIGPEAQREQILAWASRTGHEVVKWCTDIGVSGGAPLDKCPGLLEAVDYVTDFRIPVLVVAKRDRLARDVMKAAMVESLVERAKGVIYSAAGEGEGDDPSAALMRRIIDAFSEYERALIRARTKAALQTKKKKGERVGSIPYGYRLKTCGVALEPVEEEQRVIALAREIRASGASYSAVALDLMAEGIRPRSGGKWYPMQIKRMVEQSN